VEKGFSVRARLRAIELFLAWIAIAFWCALALAGCDVDRSKHRKNPHKIVTLTPSATEIVAALGATDRLIGVDQFSTFPPEVNTLPKVGSFLQPSFELIVRLRPDLVIGDDIHDDAATALRGAGIDVLLAKMHSLPDLRAAFATIGVRLGLEAQAKAAVTAIDEAIAAARTRKRGGGLRVLIVIDREAGGLGNMIAAANGSWLDELVAITGADNVLTGANVRYPKVSPEELLRAKPDVILDVSFAADPATALAEWGRLPELPAVTNGRVRVLKDAYLLGPSPRVAEALTALEAAFAPPAP
jgi:iron complex transport system substrate-binding protein